MAVVLDKPPKRLSPIERMRRAFWELEPPFLHEMYDATPELFEELSHEDLRCEFMDGVLIVHSPASPEHENLSVFVSTLINAFVSHYQLGTVFGPNAVSQLGQRRFCADVSFLDSQHAGRRRKGHILGPMDLVIEILSPTTRRYDLGRKRQAYHEGRVPEIWLIDTELRQFHLDVLRKDAYEHATLPAGQFISTVLPGLRIQVDWFWQDPLPSPLKCLRSSLRKPPSSHRKTR